MLLPILKMPWEDLSMDFVLDFPRMQQGFDALFAHFILYSKTNDVTHYKLFFYEMVHLCRLPKTITSSQDTRFLSHFWSGIS
jgi:hypothetical protein